MYEVDFSFTSTLPPEKIMGAMLDFSDRRPDLWPGLARKFYEVYEVGETTALIREGSGAPINVWAKERYDWSTPWRVEWRVQESNFSVPGSGVVMTVTPAGTGAEVRIEWERAGSNVRGKLLVPLLASGNGRMLRKFIKQGFDGLNKHEAELPVYTPPTS